MRRRAASAATPKSWPSEPLSEPWSNDDGHKDDQGHADRQRDPPPAGAPAGRGLRAGTTVEIACL